MSSIDTNGNGVAEYAEFTVLYPRMTPQIFDVMDADGDKVVDQQELFSGSTQLYLEDFGRDAGEIDVTADLDGDGSITMDELATIFPGFSADTYAAMDLNGDGELDIIEFNTSDAQAVLTAWEDSVTFIRVGDYDADGDGVLSLEELQVAVPDLDAADLEPIEVDNVADAGDRVLYRPVARIDR